LPDLDAADPEPAQPSVFLSYASGDREAARLLRDALPGYGLEVWYDESELGGGEAWDQKIRRQIRECDYFMPVVSAQTEARLEGYFRREWRLAVERTLDMADDHLFLLPIVIDNTVQANARVPEKFLAVQWLKVPGGRPTSALESVCRKLAAGDLAQAKPARAARRKEITKAAALPQAIPEFPRQEPGQKALYWGNVFVWACRSSWVLFNRLPRWVRVLFYIWLVTVLFSNINGSRHRNSSDVSPEKVEKLKAISQNYQGTLKKNDLVNLGAQIAKEFADDSDEGPAEGSALLAIPFSAPAADAAGQKLADSTFAMTYGMASISHHGQVSLTKEPLSSRDLGAALERGKANHSTYVLYGTVDNVNGAEVLTVKIAAVADGSVVWSKSYPAAGANPSTIASDVDAKIPALAPK